MGTGKSSVGRALAKRLGREFIDTDLLIQAKRGKPIPQIFAEEGEAAFRAAERAAVLEAAAVPQAVIATGGGVLADPGNLAALRAAGTLVCLAAAPEVILRRIGRAEGRPMLAGQPDPLAAIARLLAARADLYAAADMHLDTSGLTVEQVVNELCTAFASP